MCFDFLYKFVCDISYSKKNSARYHYLCTSVFVYNTGYSRQILIKLEFISKDF